MGGFGSGRGWHSNAAACTDDYRQLDVRRWQREGYLMLERAFNWGWTWNGETIASIRVKPEGNALLLSYRHRDKDNAWKQERYTVQLDWTECSYGGERAWFLCPAKSCGRRVAILYGGDIFACRHCYQLVYRSQRENDDERVKRRLAKIRASLGWPPGSPHLNTKPNGMRCRTFERLTAEHEALVLALSDHHARRTNAMAATLSRIESRLR